MVIVTGGTGYIGSHTVVELINAGKSVVILDDLSNSRIEVIDAIEEITGTRPLFHRVDLADAEALKNVFDKIGEKAEAVVHFAAKKAVGESVEKPLLYYRNNLFGLVNLLEEMQRFSIEKLVFSSSCTVYGQPSVIPVTEETPRQKAESPYGNTKSIAEDIISDCCKVSPLKAISLRYFNPIGAHASAKIGELPVGTPTNLVPYVTQTAAGVRQELTVHGDDYPTEDGTCIRDYIHVVDLAKAHLKALERLDKEVSVGGNHEFFNVGTGKGSSVMEVIETFKAATGVNIPYKIGERRPGDVTEIYADTSFAEKELCWKAELNLKDALGSSWNWEKNYRNIKA
ncbi:MAG: UDP-glucose 4-epimerase GalE [Flavobacteriales bacterium]|nr:UDP-glucose 4-epimerase GalE [Flavobacteriales bacterium]MCB9191103.1 UDP-glucose 4-epimerase GalE [Flavobacteriales bacterium]MCB9203449.1 UDP-glucose 4-epimerase GalE [Flavobacteriales bacterium]